MVRMPRTATTALLALVLSVSAQEEAASLFCDTETDICFQRYYNPYIEASYGWAFPPLSATGHNSTEFIGLLVAPINFGWGGVSLSDGMREALLLVGWLDGDEGVVSPRYTLNVEMPKPYDGPKITVLSTTGKNETHQRILYRCQNCTKWDGGEISLNSTEAVFGWAIGAEPVDEPADVNTRFVAHTGVGLLAIDLSAAHFDDYYKWVEKYTPTEKPTNPKLESRQTVSAVCPGNLRATYNLNVASGWSAEPVLKSLTSPRGITIDSAGNLLVVQRGRGLTGHAVDANGCVTSTKTIVSDTGLNHGVEVSVDGKRLFASTADILYSWTYDASTMTVSGRTTLVTGMNNANPDHTTRTVVQSKKDPNFIVVGRGSTNNLDMAAYQASTGRAIVKTFDLRTLPANGVSYSSGGKIMAYGVRNDVGFAEDKAGNFISVENSAGNMRRSGTDVHNNNPGEPVYNLGSVTNPPGFWGGYPYCFHVWDPPSFRDKTFKVGDLFVQEPNNTVNDAWCESKVTKPLLLLPPHTAPLDFKLGVGSDTNGYSALHGSWNRNPPIGYKVVVIPGNVDSTTGAWTPKSPITASQTATTDLLWNNDASRCQSGCFRPVGLVFDSTGKNLYVSSDQTGEVFLLKRT